MKTKRSLNVLNTHYSQSIEDINEGWILRCTFESEGCLTTVSRRFREYHQACKARDFLLEVASSFQFHIDPIFNH